MNIYNKVFVFVLALAFWPLTLPILNQKSLFITVGFFLLLITVPIRFKEILNNNKLNKYMLFFFIVVLITMLIRGVGFEILGSSMIGGFLYLSVIAGVLFLLLANTVTIDLKKFHSIVIIVLVISLILVFMQALASVNIIANPFFLLPPRELETTFSMKQEDIGFTRLFNLGAVATIFFMIILLTRKKNFITKREYFYLVVAILIASLSGHRISILSLLGLFVFAVIFSDSNYTQKIKNIILLILGGFVFAASFVLLFGHIPEIILRALSFIPGIENVDASGTSEWRIKLWMIALEEEVPKYLIIGKGLVRDPYTLITTTETGINASYLWAMESLNYHQGPLVMVIAFGIPALIFFIIFHYKLISRVIKYRKYLINDDVVQKVFASSFISIYITNICLFLFVYGDLSNNFIRLNIITGILIVLIRNSNKNLVLQ